MATVSQQGNWHSDTQIKQDIGLMWNLDFQSITSQKVMPLDNEFEWWESTDPPPAGNNILTPNEMRELF